MSNFHEQLKKIRKEKNVTQEQLAEFLNASRQTISKWESGKSLPDIENAQQLATYFNVDINELLGNENNIVDIRKTNKKKRRKKILSIVSASITTLLIFFGGLFYSKYYSDPDKEIVLYDVYSISSKGNGLGVVINTTDNQKIRVKSYFDIIKYSFQHKEPQNLNEVRSYSMSKKRIEKTLKEDEEYRKKLENETK